MFTILLMAALPVPQPAYFKVNLETNTEVSIFINGQQLQPGTVYKTEPLAGQHEVEITVKFVNWDKVEVRTMILTLTPGKLVVYTITIECNPPCVVKV